MTPATTFTVAVLVLVGTAAVLAYVLGVISERMRNRKGADEAWRDGFDVGAGTDTKTRHIERRARFQR